MLLHFLEGLGFWALPMAGLWVWAGSLVLHRLVAAVHARRRVQRVRQVVSRLIEDWTNADVDQAWQTTRAAGCLALVQRDRQLTLTDRALANAVPSDGAVDAASADVELFAGVAPLIGLAGTVSGLMLAMRSAHAGGTPDLANIGVAMGTTLGAIVPLILVLVVYGKLSVDPNRIDERRLLIRLQRVSRERLRQEPAKALPAVSDEAWHAPRRSQGGTHAD